ncbi:glycylpeptide N-tetradecanoyltransferase, partial [Kappamyces sp. JEL0829]
MAAIRKATNYMLQNPDLAFKTFCEMKPELATFDNEQIYKRSFPYFSKDLLNVERDWDK